MKRFITSLVAFIMLAASLSASATSYGGYVRNFWVGPNRDITFYFLDSGNTTYITGLCGWGLYVLQANKTNYDETYAALLLASKNSYKVLMEVSSCSGNTNIIDQVKVCTWTGDC